MSSSIGMGGVGTIVHHARPSSQGTIVRYGVITNGSNPRDPLCTIVPYGVITHGSNRGTIVTQWSVCNRRRSTDNKNPQP